MHTAKLIWITPDAEALIGEILDTKLPTISHAMWG